jgi:hypothetical protein
MIQRLHQPHGSGNRSARRRARQAAGNAPPGGTVPVIPPQRVDGDDLDGLTDESDVEIAPDDIELLVLRRADWVAAAPLVLAGVSANVSLVLPWTHDEASTGLSMVRRGVDLLGGGLDRLAIGGAWQPLAVVIGGGLFVLLGLLLLVPAHAHRLVGVLALVVTLGAAAAMLVLLGDAGWQLDRFGIGTWFAAGVPALGVLGALKAMLTVPRVAIVPRETIETSAV